VRTLLDTPELRATADLVMREVLTTGNRDLEDRGSESQFDIELAVRALFALTESLGDYRTSMAIDFLERRPLEVEMIHGAVVRRARELGVSIPHTEKLYAAVRRADPAGRPAHRG